MPTRNRYEGIDPLAVGIVRSVARRIAWQCVLSEEDQQDIEQDLVVVALRALTKFDPSRGTKGGFLRRVIRNKVRNMLAERRAACRDSRRVAYSLQDPVEGDADSEPTERGDAFDVGAYLRLTRGEPDPEDRADLQRQLETAVESLPPHLQAICLLLYQGLTKTDIARELGISRPTLHDRVKDIEQQLGGRGVPGFLKSDPTLRDRRR